MCCSLAALHKVLLLFLLVSAGGGGRKQQVINDWAASWKINTQKARNPFVDEALQQRRSHQRLYLMPCIFINPENSGRRLCTVCNVLRRKCSRAIRREQKTTSAWKLQEAHKVLIKLKRHFMLILLGNKCAHWTNTWRGKWWKQLKLQRQGKKYYNTQS